MIRDESILKLADEKNSKYILYYDETNNIRRLYLEEVKLLNIPIEEFEKNFAMGGVAVSKENKEINFEKLIRNLKIDRKIIESLENKDANQEIKFKHIGKKGNNNFLEVLDLKNISAFLTWFNEENLYIHYSSINLLYWAIIDILEFEYDTVNQVEHSKLKTVVYLCAKLNLERFLYILKKHNYPNIQRNNRSVFVYDLKRFLTKNKTLFKKTYYNYKYDGISEKDIDIVINLLERNITNLPFLVDEKDNVLIDDLLPFYFTRMTQDISNSIHVFDEEDKIEEKLEIMKKGNSKIDWERVIFKNSKNDILIQISDIFIGLIGKAFQLVNTSSYENILHMKDNLNNRQLSNLLLMSQILHQSNEKTKIFLHTVESEMDRKKFWTLFEK